MTVLQARYRLQLVAEMQVGSPLRQQQAAEDQKLGRVKARARGAR
jgi:hypothetical protein